MVGKGEHFPKKSQGLTREEGGISILKCSCDSEKQQGDGKKLAEVLMFKGSETTKGIRGCARISEAGEQFLTQG